MFATDRITRIVINVAIENCLTENLIFNNICLLNTELQLFDQIIIS